jgi:hypothetical protein
LFDFFDVDFDVDFDFAVDFDFEVDVHVLKRPPASVDKNSPGLFRADFFPPTQ